MSNLLRTYYDQGLNTKAFRYGALLLIVAAILCKVHLIFCLNINWDEFYYLSFLHSYLRGDSIDPLASFHVHFFSWIPFVSWNEINQILVARCLMCLMSVGSGILVYKVGRIYLSEEGSLFSTLCYFCYSNIMLHGSSFRMDPICSFLFLVALYFILSKPDSYKGAVIAGVMLGLSVMVTIKSFIYLLCIAAIYLVNFLSSAGKEKVVKHAAVFGAALLSSLALLYGYHIFSLTGAEIAKDVSASPAHTQGMSFSRLGNIFSKMFLEEAFFPRLEHLKTTLLDNFIIWLYLFMGLVLVLKELLKKSARSLVMRPLLPLLILPLTLIFYRNAWPYYYVFIMPPLFIYCGMFVDEVVVFMKNKKSAFLWGILCILFLSVFVSMANVYVERSSDEMITQRKMVTLVHHLFPKLTPYIDAFSMISSYPKVGFFMSTWGVENYRKENIPIFRDLIIKHRPVFLIANRAWINPKYMWDKKNESQHRLLDKDAEAIRQNYVKHWGSLYVAGKKITFTDSRETIQFEILIPGVYTVEAQDVITINGIDYPPKSQVMLEHKQYEISAKNKPVKVPMHVTLRWGKNLFRPTFSYSKMVYPLR